MLSQSAKQKHNREVAALVARLLNHYSTGRTNEPAVVRQQQIEDWIVDVGEFRIDILADACAAYRQSPHYFNRPQPGDIRRLCIEIQTEQAELAAAKQLPSPEVQAARAERTERELQRKTDSEREGHEIGRRWAQQRGFVSLEGYARAKGIDYRAAACEVIRSNLSGSSREPVGGFVHPAAALGVTATEYKATPEQMRDSRAALGIPEPESATEVTQEGVTDDGR